MTNGVSFFRSVEQRDGREYLRVSYDRSGRERSQDEQHDDNARAASESGVTLRTPYREAGSASASRYGRKVRDDFERLLGDLEAGRFGAAVLVLWESSRGSRKVGEWVTLIDLCEQQGVSIFVTTHGREYQPGNGRDRRSLLEDAVDSEYESSKTSSRAKRAAAHGAEAGRPHGPTPFGYQRTYDPFTRRLVAQEPHPLNAQVVRELFAQLKAGVSLYAIAQEFEAKGYRNKKGEAFTPPHLRTMALNPAYAGIRAHNPGKGPGGHTRLTTPGVESTPGTWDGLVSRADFLSVQAMLSDPTRTTAPRPGGAKHLLSMIAKCDVCGTTLAVTTRVHESGEYQCRKAGHIRCRKVELDTYAQEAILGYLGDPDNYEMLTAGEGQGDEELTRVRDDLGTARAELDDLRAQVAARKLSVASLVAVEPGLLALIGELEGRENELITPSALRGLIEPGTDVAQRWEQMPVSARRRVMRMLLSAEWLGELRIQPRPVDRRHIHVPVAERVRWVGRQPGQEQAAS